MGRNRQKLGQNEHELRGEVKGLPLDVVSAVISLLYVLWLSLCWVTSTPLVWGSQKCSHCFTTHSSDGQRGRVTETEVQVVDSVVGLPVGG